MKHFIDLLATEIWFGQAFFGEQFAFLLGSATVLCFRKVNVVYSVYSPAYALGFSSNWFYAGTELFSKTQLWSELHDFI